MKDVFQARFTGLSFLAAAAMLWLGWVLLPVKIGPFFEPEHFAAIHERFHAWIWLFRIHLFGLVAMVVALTALAAGLQEGAARVVVWPGVLVAAAGLFVTALASAFYYHFGAWGSLDMHGKSPAEVVAFVDSLRVNTEYVTCLVRFGRVFTGLGFLLFGAGVTRWAILSPWLGGVAAALGLAAMALTMGRPDDLHLFAPIFHSQAAWLAIVGLSILRRARRGHTGRASGMDPDGRPSGPA